MAEKINLNTAAPKELTQLPGVAKNLAYRIVSHRERHGLFTQWEELAEVKDFPVEDLEKIKERATIDPPAGINPADFPAPRHLKASHVEDVTKKTSGYTHKIRTTRRQDRMRESS